MNIEKLKNFVFNQYDKGEISTDDAAELLTLDIADFIDAFEEWHGAYK